MDRGYLSEAFVSYQGEGLLVGRRQLFLRFAGCPLRCRYCDTPESLVRTDSFVVHGAQEERRSNPVSIEDIAWALDVLQGDSAPVDGIAITGGEPLAQSEFLATLLASGVLPRPRLLETAGISPHQLAAVLDEIDVVSMDIKLPSNSGETPFWDQHERFLLVARNKVYVKIGVDEGTSRCDVDRATALVASITPQAPVFLQPITGPSGAPTISAATLATLYETARRRVDDLRVVPQTHKALGLR